MEVAFAGLSAVAPTFVVVEIAVDRWHSTTRKDTPGVPGFHVAAERGAGAPFGDAVDDEVTGLSVGDAPSPLGVFLFLGDLAGDVGDHRAVALQLTRMCG